MLVAVIISNDLHAEPLAYNDKIFDITIGEAKKYSNDGNPMDMLIKYREEKGSDVFRNYKPILIGLGKHEGIDFYIGEANYDINDEIKKGINEIKNKYNNHSRKFNFVNIILIFLIIIIISTFLYKKTRIMIFLIPVLMFFISLFTFIRGRVNVNKGKSLYEYLKNDGIEISNNVIRMETIYPFTEINISYEVNYLIEKIRYVYNHLDDYREVYMNDTFNPKSDVVNFSYLEKECMLYDGVNNDMVGINVISENPDIRNKDICRHMYNNKENLGNDRLLQENINKFSELIEYREPSKEESLFDFAKKIGILNYIALDQDYKMSRTFKDWYIEGDDKIIELPYGMYLHYKAPRLLKKDVKEIVCVNVNELDPLSEDNILKVFYLDSNDDLKYDFTICKFIEEDGKQKLYYEPYTILYDVRCASTVFSMNKELEYIDNRPTEVLVKKY